MTSHYHVGIFRSAITGADGTINVGYLALFWLLVVVINAIPLMCIGSFVSMLIATDHLFRVQELGTGIGAVCVGFAAALAGLGAYLWGDSKQGIAPPGITTRKETTTELSTTAAAVAPMEAL